jgi:hypothetical protein
MTGLAESSARTAWSTLRKKSLAGKEDAVAPKTPGSAAEKKKAPAKRKSTGGKKGENGEDLDGGNNAETAAETPSKKPRGRPPKAKATEHGDDDSEMKDDGEAPAATPAKKKPTPRKPAAAKKAKATSKTPEAEFETKAAREKAQASPGPAQVDSDETAHEDESSITVESSGETVEVDVKNDKTEVTMTEKAVAEKDEVEEGEKATTS